ncbi:hypothetical protein M407DRAFT_82363 [Tulasnella calospora MUT 4182]|uniref:Mitochondrial import inner membrane translocase subunit TIM50 n=1 Tax=Tulasnella calospora MUT 4182 TaxID=1051891 RepID=A0A0C3KEA2_9AGAM|nr:hypothetical protein M407DRAFT_82363 [Tulasnella calospora MUT 4182]
MSAPARQSSEPIEGVTSHAGSAGNSDAAASSPPPLKKRRHRDKSRNREPSSSPPGPSLSAATPEKRFTTPPKWTRTPEKQLPKRSPGNRRDVSKVDTFIPGKPTQEYLDEVNIPSQRSEPRFLATESAKAKLLILDLNGTLLYRKKPKTSSVKRPYPRPYIPAFLSWIFHPDNALETMIWSSAQPENVNRMVQVCFGETYEPKLKVIWARDTLGLNQAQYNQKVQTVKNLDVVWKELPYSAGNTLLIDDSPLKAHMQPYNHIVLREYDHALFVRRHDPEAPKDETLLGVIGLLSEAIRQSNVAHWIREGGPMKPPGFEAPEQYILEPSATNPKEGASPQPKRSSSLSRSVTSSPVLASNADTLPDSSEVERMAAIETLWFQDEAILAAWVQIGRVELERLGIAPEVGAIDGEGNSSML